MWQPIHISLFFHWLFIWHASIWFHFFFHCFFLHRVCSIGVLHDICTSETNNFLKINEDIQMNLVNEHLRIFYHRKTVLHSTSLSFSLFLSSLECIQSSPSENSACESILLSIVPGKEAKKLKELLSLSRQNKICQQWLGRNGYTANYRFG